jgi:hypothetical protein
MNKIPMLEKFAAQSLVSVDTGLDDGPELIFSKEKFAELIVKECIRLCDQVDIVGADECIDNIKQHFGVEECTN